MASTEIQGADASPVAIPKLRSATDVPPFSDELMRAIEKLLPAYIIERRWFRSKARSIRQVEVADVVRISASTFILVLQVAYADGPEDNYLLPLTIAAGLDDAVRNAPATEPLAAIESPGGESLVFSAFANPAFRSALLSAVAEHREFRGHQGALVAERIITAPEDQLDPNLESAVSRAEQSNTSVIYANRFILKLFRKIEEGENPDLEVGAFLTRSGFPNTPAVIGTLAYRDGGTHAAGLLQRFVSNRGDAWAYTLSTLSGFFDRALSASATAADVPASHPLDLLVEPVPADAQETIGPYLQSARLLGQRTAEMHSTLAAGAEPAFRPEPVTSEDGQRFFGEMHAQADIAFDLLRAKQPALSGEAAADGRQLLEREADVRRRFDNLREASISVPRIRIHGDYHLGQVLYTGSDFMIIDFEGEPARPLEERRRKALAVRDVAGMIRSFEYAAYAPLFGQSGTARGHSADPQLAARWAAYWYAWVTRTFLQGYVEAAAGGNFFPFNNSERRMLLDAFLLHKALYEVAYELNNRPAWVRIPVRGILHLIG